MVEASLTAGIIIASKFLLKVAKSLVCPENFIGSGLGGLIEHEAEESFDFLGSAFCNSGAVSFLFLWIRTSNLFRI